MYSFASATFAVGFDVKSKPGPSSPPASSKPAIPGGRKCVAVVPSVGPPRVCRSAVRSITALIARRTLTLSSGLTVVLSEM